MPSRDVGGVPTVRLGEFLLGGTAGVAVAVVTVVLTPDPQVATKQPLTLGPFVLESPSPEPTITPSPEPIESPETDRPKRAKKGSEQAREPRGNGGGGGSGAPPPPEDDAASADGGATEAAGTGLSGGTGSSGSTGSSGGSTAGS